MDRLLFDVKNPKLIAIAASSGEITMQERHLDFSNYTLLMENREKSHYQLYHWFDSTTSGWSIWPNLNRRVKPGDAESKWKAQLLNEGSFPAGALAGDQPAGDYPVHLQRHRRAFADGAGAAVGLSQ